MKTTHILSQRKAPYSAEPGDVIPVQIGGVTVFAKVTDKLTSQQMDVEVVITGEVTIRKALKPHPK